MKQYHVTGMSCAACSSRVEKAVGKVPGVTSCSVSLLTNSMGVEGTAAEDEIVRAVRRLTEEVVEGRMTVDDITEEKITAALDTCGIPEPDLLIRTCNEQRISNFLLWQLAYTELYFTPVAWPDFSKEELEKAITAYNSRDRRYGLVKEV